MLLNASVETKFLAESNEQRSLKRRNIEKQEGEKARRKRVKQLAH